MLVFVSTAFWAGLDLVGVWRLLLGEFQTLSFWGPLALFLQTVKDVTDVTLDELIMFHRYGHWLIISILFASIDWNSLNVQF